MRAARSQDIDMMDSEGGRLNFANSVDSIEDDCDSSGAVLEIIHAFRMNVGIKPNVGSSTSPIPLA